MTKRKDQKADMYTLIREWESSELSQKLFLKDKEIVKSTFGYWRKKYLQDKQAKQRSGFIPVQVSDPIQDNPVMDESFIELTYANGVQLKCSDNLPHSISLNNRVFVRIA